VEDLKFGDMPTLYIPDRICPHCQGTKWNVTYREGKSPQYTCAVILKERARKRYLANPEMYKEKAKRRSSRLWLIKDPAVLEKLYAKQREWKRNNPDKVKAYKRKTGTRIRNTMTDEYIKRQIIQLDGFEHLSFNTIPQRLIEIKRKQLSLFRLSKQLKNEKINITS
jgi:hemolysin-activating ACP:hemolysin acyltransferase